MNDSATPAAVAGRSLRDRVLQLDRASRRLHGFVADAGPGQSSPDGPDDQPTVDDCRAMVMRAVHVASAPSTGRMLLHMCAQPRTSAELSRLTARPRLVAWEEISDLVQAGLAERDLEHDLVRPTPAGLALADLIGEMTDALSARVTR